MPMLVIVDYAPRIFSYDGDINTVSAEDVTNFLAAHKAGKAEELKRSQPIPAEPTVDGLTTLVHKTFDATYNDYDKDVLVFMYYKGCPNSEKIQPLIEQIAKENEAKEDLVVAVYDLDFNHLELTDVKLCSLVLNSKKNVQKTYDQDLEMDDLRKYLVENGIKVSVPEITEEEVKQEEL